MPEYSNLFEKTLYTTDKFQYLFGDLIVEYDIESAGFNICKEFKLLDEDKIKEIEKMGKKDRQIALGYIQKEDKEFINKLNEGFKNCRKWFFENNLIRDEDVLSVKKDAIFLRKRRCKNTEFGNIKFRIKNEYNSFMNINNLEFYCGDSDFSCKGIRDEVLKLHKNFMLSFINEYMKAMCVSKKDTINMIKMFATFYRDLKLEHEFYRELNHESLYKPKKDIKIFSNVFGFNDYGMNLKYLDISYNYMNYIVPMHKILV